MGAPGSRTSRDRDEPPGPEHFGIASLDCAKARFRWMLYGLSDLNKNDADGPGVVD